MKKQVGSMLVALMLLSGIVGCAKQPTEEISSSQASVETAVQEGADVYAKAELQSVEQDLKAAMDEVAVQDKKIFKNYDKAKQMLAKVKSGSEQIKTVVVTRREEARQKAVADLGAAQSAIENAKNQLSMAPKGKGSSADLAAMEADLTGLNEAVLGVQPLIDAGDFAGASEKAGAVSLKANDISAQVTLAMEKMAEQKRLAAEAKAAKKGKKK